MPWSIRDRAKRGLVVAVAALLLLLLALDLIRPDSIVRSLLGLGESDGPRETLRRFLDSVREGDVWPGGRP
ncbi:MAG: hypothetical protein GWM92_10890 [Gemmatimonadetes bacterium]|nr:hypothetical protein [Gemmatimonadota bacterium]NIR79196.1 hypothetical protein [Gemmatimonadota bacterium]NIT87856.1 hypothetical protein [Gemmatimonadota bacterium]NIU31712.1 hypothetical protein [Gemmatimonadota bacterium]NIU36332.1 hypothetical protein [Gemmatimonadota bacterium]